MKNTTARNEGDYSAVDVWAERVASLMFVDAADPRDADGIFSLFYDSANRFQSGTFRLFGIRFLRRPLATGTEGWMVDPRDIELALDRMRRGAPDRIAQRLIPRTPEERSNMLRAMDEYRYQSALICLKFGKLDQAVEEWRCISSSFPDDRKAALRAQIKAAKGSEDRP